MAEHLYVVPSTNLGFLTILLRQSSSDSKAKIQSEQWFLRFLGFGRDQKQSFQAKARDFTTSEVPLRFNDKTSTTKEDGQNAARLR